MKFAGTLCRVIDVYTQLATISSQVQKVKHFLWEMINTLKEGIKTLRLMAEVCNLEREWRWRCTQCNISASIP